MLTSLQVHTAIPAKFKTLKSPDTEDHPVRPYYVAVLAFLRLNQPLSIRLGVLCVTFELLCIIFVFLFFFFLTFSLFFLLIFIFFLIEMYSLFFYFFVLFFLAVDLLLLLFRPFITTICWSHSYPLLS